MTPLDTDADLDAETELPQTPLAAALARGYVAELVPVEIVDDARLLVSELVSNAIRHGGPGISMRVTRRGGRVRVGVRDSGGGVPVLPADAGDPTATGGRGLLVVSLLSQRWGVEPAEPPPGKTVWVEFELAPSPRTNGHAPNGHAPNVGG